MKNFNVFGVHGKIRVLEWGFHEKPIYRRHCLEWGGGGVGGRRKIADLRGEGLGKKRGRGEVDTPMHTMNMFYSYQ